jgi:hypothetical protein
LKEGPLRILYLHGLGSKPGGVKPTHLAANGHEVVNPALPDDDFEQSVAIAQRAFDEIRPDVVVGSSRGGAVAMRLAAGETPLILIAPAWRRRGVPPKVKPGTVILHSVEDEIVPIADSREIVAASELPDESLVVVGADHSMIDARAFAALDEALVGV